MLAARTANLENGQRASPIGEGAVTQQAAADMLNVGKRSVEHAREVINEALPKIATEMYAGLGACAAHNDDASMLNHMGLFHEP